jgi:hypothetical protein
MIFCMMTDYKHSYKVHVKYFLQIDNSKYGNDAKLISNNFNIEFVLKYSNFLPKKMVLLLMTTENCNTFTIANNKRIWTLIGFDVTTVYAKIQHTNS